MVTRALARVASEMTAQIDSLESCCSAPAACKTQPADLELTPAFRLTQQFAPPRTAVLRLDRIKPHPALIRCDLLPTQVQFEPLRDRTEKLFDEPICVTDEGILIDGYERWIIARERHIYELPCVVRTLSLDEAMVQILQKTQATRWLDRIFCRFELARALVSPQRERAKENQRAAGRKKHLAKLQKAERINVQKEIAQLVGCSPRQVGKMEDILANGIPLLKQKLRHAPITIHAAWKISRLRADEQTRELGPKESQCIQTKRIRALSRAILGIDDDAKHLLDQVWRNLEQLCKLKPLAKYGQRSRELLAEMERELGVAVPEKIVKTTEAV
jgi:ParB-like chromosome segregation protein Spo0J